MGEWHSNNIWNMLYSGNKLKHNTPCSSELIKMVQYTNKQGTPETNWSLIQYTSKNVKHCTQAIIGAR